MSNHDDASGLFSNEMYEGLFADFGSTAEGSCVYDDMEIEPNVPQSAIDSASMQPTQSSSSHFAVEAALWASPSDSPSSIVPELERPGLLEFQGSISSPASFSLELTPISSPTFARAALCTTYGGLSIDNNELDGMNMSSSLISRQSSSSIAGPSNDRYSGIPNDDLQEYLKVPRSVQRRSMESALPRSSEDSVNMQNRKDRYRQKCEYCGKSLSNTGNLHKHWQTACKACPSKFKLEKPRCRWCHVKCTTKSNRNNHEKMWCPKLRDVEEKKLP